MSVELSKGQKVELRKAPSGIVRIRLIWGGNFDLDLAALWEDVNGKTGCLQALNGNPDAAGGFGSFGRAPFAYLHKDERSGGEELMELNLVRTDQLQRFLPFAYIYPYDESGRRRNYTWRDIRNAHVIIEHPTEGERIFRLDHSDGQSCTLMDFQSNDSGGLTMMPLGKFYNGFHEVIDRDLGWPQTNWHGATK